jgi:hypothetical protein
MTLTHNEKQGGEDNESHELERSATPRIDDEKRSQITGHEGR